MDTNQKVTQAVITSQAQIKDHQKVERFSLFDEDGDPIIILTAAETGADVLLTGYDGPDGGEIEATDSVNDAIAILETALQLVPVFTVVTTATAIGTAAKTTDADEPPANSLVAVKFTNGNSAGSPTVAFDGGSARSILLAGAAPSAGEITVAANGVAFFFFDGNGLHQFGAVS